MRFLSLFSGIEACSVAWKPLGWSCVGFSEIEPFACALLSHYYPEVPNLGDVTKITEDMIKSLGEFDLMVFGSPCTNLSVVGDRKGLDGDESTLFFEAMRIFSYARKHCGCRFALWENVPGSFSTNAGADFATVVGQMAGCTIDPAPKWERAGAARGSNGLLEWRVFDAQYFGVAQRRKRVFALLDTGNWFDRPPIFIEPEGQGRDTDQSGEAGCYDTTPSKGCSGELAYSIHADPTPKISSGVCGTLRSQGGGGVVPPIVVYGDTARRLTPVECERLMGFPDGYTDIIFNGKRACNSARHRALGNSMAVPVMRYIGQAIDKITEDTHEMMTQSPTSLQTFLTCPKQYHAKYITKEVKFQQNPHAEFGDLVHKSIENFLMHGEELPELLKPVQPNLEQMKKVLYGAETKLAVTKEGKPCTFFDKNAYQRCIVDAILTSADKRTIICIDWKTGKHRDAQTQHDFIKKCASAHFPEAQEVVTLFVYLMQGTSDRQVYKPGSPLIELDRDMNKLAGAYAVQSFPPEPSGLCKKWCDVLSCPHNGRS